MSKQIASGKLLDDLRHMINETRWDIAQAVNSALVVLYWNIGARIRSEILNETRAEYGEKIVHAVSAQLSAEFGEGFSDRN
jgi:hypothetical protein